MFKKAFGTEPGRWIVQFIVWAFLAGISIASFETKADVDKKLKEYVRSDVHSEKEKNDEDFKREVRDFMKEMRGAHKIKP